MTKKLTKKEMFAMMYEVIKGVEVENKNEMLDFIDHEVELLNRKHSSNGESKTQKENKILMEQLREALAQMPRPVTISEFQNLSTHEVATLSNQKLSALLKKMIDSGTLVACGCNLHCNMLSPLSMIFYREMQIHGIYFCMFVITNLYKKPKLDK